MSSGVIYFVQTFRPPEESSTFIIEMLEHYKKVKNEKDSDNINKFCWMSRLNCYCEGTKFGFLKMRDYRNKGQCILQLPLLFGDKVRLLHHDKTKNLLFAASRDGQYFAWKLPPEWSPDWIEKKLREIRLNAGQVGFKNW